MSSRRYSLTVVVTPPPCLMLSFTACFPDQLISVNLPDDLDALIAFTIKVDKRLMEQEWERSKWGTIVTARQSS